jgi:Response regulator containing CheY-like receiver domain and AraC-type DNA-binding domain
MFKAVIVDDEPNIREGLRKIIDWGKHGFIIIGQASDGIEALEIYDQEKYDLVISDIKMPRMDGLELSRELKSRNPEIKVLIVSGYDDFSYAKEAIKYGVNSYLLKPVDSEELCNVLTLIQESLVDKMQNKRREMEQSNALKEYFLFKFVRGELLKDFSSKAIEYDIDLYCESFCFVIIEIDNYGEFLLNLSEDDIYLKKFEMRNIIEELIKNRNKVHLFDYSDNQFGLLITGSGKFQSEMVFELSSDIANCIYKYLNESITIGIGEIVLNSSEIKTSYKKALYALERKMFSHSGKVLRYEDFIEFDNIQNIEWKDAELLEAIRKCDRRLIYEEIMKFYNEANRINLSLSIIRRIISNIVLDISKIIVEHNGDWDKLYANKNIDLEKIILFGTLSEFKEYILNISVDACQFIEALMNQKSGNALDEIKIYIQQHHFEDFNLKELSGMFYINSVYLGQLFKKSTGECFHDYINRIRIDNAKRLLDETNMSINEISEKVGYKYLDHFYRKFKKILGVNPGEYRKISLK